jgi:uncharacterized membrane protein YbhN (UPF0104 family)
MSSLLSPQLRKWAGRLVPIVFYGLLILFLALYLRSLDFSKLASVELNWWYLLLASVLALTNRYVGTFTWFTILRTLGATDLHLHRHLIYVYAKAWMGRYIPGTAPWILGKIYFASQHGISKQKLAVSSLLEGGLQIVTMLVFSLALLVFDLALFFVAKAVDPSLSYHNIAFVMGAGSLAGAASMLAIFAPSGLGVREGIQLVLFSLIMPKELALAVTIITRLWIVAIDFAFFALSRLIAGKPSKLGT